MKLGSQIHFSWRVNGNSIRNDVIILDLIRTIESRKSRILYFARFEMCHLRNCRLHNKGFLGNVLAAILRTFFKLLNSARCNNICSNTFSNFAIIFLKTFKFQLYNVHSTLYFKQFDLTLNVKENHSTNDYSFQNNQRSSITGKKFVDFIKWKMISMGKYPKSFLRNQTRIVYGNSVY